MKNSLMNIPRIAVIALAFFIYIWLAVLYAYPFILSMPLILGLTMFADKTDVQFFEMESDNKGEE